MYAVKCRVLTFCSLEQNTRARSTLPLRMSADASEDAGRAAKITVMKKLAEDAARALEEARLAEEKASAMRRENGQQSRSLNRGSDIRTKMLLGSVSDVLYKTWNGVLAGRPVDEAHDFLGLSHGEDLTSVGESERRDRVRALFQRFDTDADGRISETELAVGIKQVLEFDASEVQLQQLMREVDGDGDGKIDLDELTKVCLSIFNKAEAEAMTAADAATAAAAKQARTRTFTSVMEALDGAGGLSVDSFPKVCMRVYVCAHLRISVCAHSLTLLVLGVVACITFIHTCEMKHFPGGDLN